MTTLTLDEYFPKSKYADKPGSRKRLKMDVDPPARRVIRPLGVRTNISYPAARIKRNRTFRRRRNTYLSRRKLAEPNSALRQSVMVYVPVRYNSTIQRTQTSFDSDFLDCASIGINAFTQTGLSILNPPAYLFYSNAYKFYKVYALKIDAVFTNLSETDHHRLIVLPTDFGIVSKVQATSVGEFAKFSTQNGAVTFDLGPKGTNSDTYRYSANLNAAHVFGFSQKRYNYENLVQGTTGSTFYGIGSNLPSSLAQWNFIVDTKDGDGTKSRSRFLLELDLTWVCRFYGPKEDLGLSQPLGGSLVGTTMYDPTKSDLVGEFESISIDA